MRYTETKETQKLTENCQSRFFIAVGILSCKQSNGLEASYQSCQTLSQIRKFGSRLVNGHGQADSSRHCVFCDNAPFIEYSPDAPQKTFLNLETTIAS